MNRLLGKTFSLGVFGALATLFFAPACATNDQTIFVQNVLAPAQNRQNGSCIYSSDPTQTFQSEGFLDVGVRSTYDAELLVGSQLIPRSDSTSTRVEPNRVHINGAVVRVTDPNGGQLSTFTALSSGLLEPQQNNTPSYIPVGVTIIDTPTAVKLQNEIKVATDAYADQRLVVANVKVFGQTLGGVDVESAEFQFPIRVCNGCLVDFTTGDDKAIGGTDCSIAGATTGGSTAILPCNTGQDERVPCQICLPLAVCKSRPAQ